MKERKFRRLLFSGMFALDCVLEYLFGREKPMEERSYEEEFNPKGEPEPNTEFLDTIKSKMARLLVQWFCVPNKNGPDMKRMAMLMNACSDYSMHTMEMVDEKNKAEQQKKVSHVLAGALCEVSQQVSRTMATDATKVFVGKAMEIDPLIFSRLFTLSLYNRIDQERFSIMENEKFSSNDVVMEINRLTETLFQNGEARPQLAAEALRMIATGVSAISDVKPSRDLHRYFSQMAEMQKNMPDGAPVPFTNLSGDEIVKKEIEKRMGRVERIIATLGEETSMVLHDLQIGNPKDITNFVMAKTHSMMSDVANNAGGFGLGDN